MKAFLFLVLASTLAIAYSKNAINKRQYGPQSGSGYTCLYGFSACVAGFKQKYHSDSRTQVALMFIKAAGARQFCGDVMDAKNCAMTMLKDPSCQTLSSQLRADMGGDLAEFVCVEKLADLEKHWNCLTTPSTALKNKVDDCMIKHGRDCNFQPLSECLVNSFQNVPICDPEVGDLVSQAVEKIFTLTKNC